MERRVGKGQEQHGRRPVTVVQAQGVGHVSTVLCVPTSTSAQLPSRRVEVQVAGTDTVAVPDQVRARDSSRRHRRAGTVCPDELRDVVAQLRHLPPLVQRT